MDSDSFDTMIKFIVGEKVGMTQHYQSDGTAVPVTVVRVRPMMAVNVKTPERDGYSAVQFGIGTRKEKNVAKPQRGQFKDFGKTFRVLREGRGMAGVERGGELGIEQFETGDRVRVSGLTKSKGFQGVMKRHGFHGAPATHGTKHAHREPGSIGGSAGRAGGRVVKGMRMAGRMGGDRVSVKNLRVVSVNAEEHLIAISGAIPGRRGTLIEIRG